MQQGLVMRFRNVVMYSPREHGGHGEGDSFFFRLPGDDGKRKSLSRRRWCRFSCPSSSPDGQESRGNLCALCASVVKNTFGKEPLRSSSGDYRLETLLLLLRLEARLAGALFAVRAGIFFSPRSFLTSRRPSLRRATSAPFLSFRGSKRPCSHW